MNEPANELTAWKDRLLAFADNFDASPETAVLNTLWEKARKIGKSSSRSWLGYHANVYYANFDEPPAGVHFDIQNGTAGNYFASANPNWIEHSVSEVHAVIVDVAGEEALTKGESSAEAGLNLLKRAKADAMSILSLYLADHPDSFVQRIFEDIEKIKVLDAAEIANEKSPKGKVITQDLKAAQQGTWIPPHTKVEVRVKAMHQPSAHCRELARQLEKLSAHLTRAGKRETHTSRIGTNVFVGHGRSNVWRDLKDFVQDRLRLPHDEFNRVPVAGITNIARLSEMLDAAGCAFVIMTAEDELADGKIQARMNVIHEVGLFQGRLGFTKAIVLLEDGCEEFSNIQGLGQIRFPKGNISAKFEDIRQVLEREGLLDA